MRKTIITNRAKFPECIQQFTQLKGICVGGCIADILDKEDTAHAHYTDPFHGWMCLRFKYYLKQELVLLHEVAHLIAGPGKLPHGKRWKETVVKIGGTFKSFRFKNGHESMDYTYRHH